MFPFYFLQGDREFAFSFESITEFGLNFALRKLTKRNLEDAVLILKNLVTGISY